MSIKPGSATSPLFDRIPELLVVTVFDFGRIGIEIGNHLMDFFNGGALEVRQVLHSIPAGKSSNVKDALLVSGGKPDVPTIRFPFNGGFTFGLQGDAGDVHLRKLLCAAAIAAVILIIASVLFSGSTPLTPY